MADGLEVTGSGQAADPDQVQRIVTRTFPGLLTASPAQGGNVGSGEDKRRKKEEKKKKKKKLKKQKEKDTKKRREKSAKDVKRRSHTKNRQLAEEDNPSSQEETGKAL